MAKNISIHWLTSKIKNITLEGITHQIVALINSGEIPAGATLPSVRELANVLGVSPATISTAWSTLRKHNMITGIGRQGITVVGQSEVSTPLRFTDLKNINMLTTIDLTYSIADPQLLPDFTTAMEQSVTVKELHQNQPQPIIQALRDTVEPTWPYAASGFMAMESVFEAMAFLLKTIVLPGSSVAIEEPITISVLDILKQMQVKVITVACDKHGPIPAQLADALTQNPVAFIYQPKINTPSGYRVTKARVMQMAKLFKSNSALIIEQDIMGDLLNLPFHSLGQYYPQRTVHIRSYFRVYGPELGLAVLSASEKILQQLQNNRSIFNIGWTNRLLQQALVWLLNDTNTQKQVEYARTVYAVRNDLLINALKLRGVKLSDPAGDA